ncbi:PE-PGRS family protein [Mycobacterium tuberculosis]|nr:PE-PGRS family protein [Mycobacterium tuberculosis]
MGGNGGNAGTGFGANTGGNGGDTTIVVNGMLAPSTLGYGGNGVNGGAGGTGGKAGGFGAPGQNGLP